MKWLVDMKISGKIFSAFLAGAIAMGAIGGYSITRLIKMEEADKRLYEEVVQPLEMLNEIETSFQRILIQIRDYVWQAASDEERRKNVDRINEMKGIIESDTGAFEKNIRNEEIRSLFNQFKNSDDKYQSVIDRIVSLARAGKTDEVSMLFKNDGRVAANDVQLSIENLIEKIDSQGKVLLKANMSSSGQSRVVMIIFSILSVIGATAMGMFASKFIGNPINKCVEFAKAVAEGDLSGKTNVERGDDIGRLFKALDGMAGNLRRLVEELRNAANDVAGASRELSVSSGQTSRGVEEQSSRASQIAAAAQEMSQTITDVARNAAEIANSAAATAGTARDGEKIVTKSVNEVKAIADTVSESARFIATLGVRSKEIGEIVNVIKDIADQTNLLALNAAIEAARAGEQGRGFAVVADEVRKLAERTSKATSEISGMIGSIQSEVDKAVSSMDEATRRVETGVDYSTQAGMALSKIVTSVESLHSMVHQIATATEEMSTVSEQITNDIDAIAGVSKDTSRSSGHISESASSLSELSSGLLGIVEQFNTGQSGHDSQPRP
ncbi:MAG: methyl-accepting chemotaxis protein [Nitrospirae bacterium]|nr:methyl-accepting chemotaxis protein [Nitrospirota bacterium]